MVGAEVKFQYFFVNNDIEVGLNMLHSYVVIRIKT